ncbi:MAG: sel1 repeat family protein [Nitrosomonadales bacterium]|nr:sel1 repeat family protein [Nitrosomonadales bacterium]
MVRLIMQMFSLLVLGSVLAGPAMADPLSDAQKAYSVGSYAKALDLYTALAKRGDANAQLGLGVMYYLGQGVTQSYKDAAKWFQRSAEQGNFLAQDILGEMHDQGLGVPQDYQQAAKWYRLAAEQGDANAQYNLGIMYARELGVPQDFVLAYMWMSLSAKFPEELALVAKQMSPDQIVRAQERAAQCAAQRFRGC